MNWKNAVIAALLVGSFAGRSWAQKAGKVTGTVLDELNAMSLPMAPVEVVESGEVVYTDLDGRFAVELPPGT